MSDAHRTCKILVHRFKKTFSSTGCAFTNLPVNPENIFHRNINEILHVYENEGVVKSESEKEIEGEAERSINFHQNVMSSCEEGCSCQVTTKRKVTSVSFSVTYASAGLVCFGLQPNLK